MILIFFHGILILRYLYFDISKIINKGSGNMKEKEWKVIPYYGLQKNYFSKNATLEFI